MLNISSWEYLLKKTQLILVIIVLSACGGNAPKSTVKITKLSRLYNCSDKLTEGKGALIWLPDQPSKVIVVPADKVNDYVGLGKYSLINWCERRP